MSRFDVTGDEQSQGRSPGLCEVRGDKECDDMSKGSRVTRDWTGTRLCLSGKTGLHMRI